TSVSTIPNSHGFIRVQGSGAPVQLSSSPQISTGADGQLMVLKGSHNTNTLNLISKNGVTLNESTEFKMGQKDLIFLFFDADDNEWIEMGRSDN
ncbi:MAG: hypothetical protein LW817_01590, partial [Candidatus Caenarcaniphilales bacterium]|nr:hypothetical protein [Candidatus Caenarcaniphilales bacterium]